VSPDLAPQLRDQVIPMLDELQTVAPDLQDLVGTSKALNEIIGSLPGLGRVKKRAEEEFAHHDGNE